MSDENVIPTDATTTDEVVVAPKVKEEGAEEVAEEATVAPEETPAA